MYRSCITISRASCSRMWQGDMAETPKRPIAASDDCLKRQKASTVKSTRHWRFTFRLSNGGKYTPYGLFYFHCIVVSADSKSSPFFRGHRFFLFGGFESTSSAKVSYYATSLISIIILSNTQLRVHLLNKI